MKEEKLMRKQLVILLGAGLILGGFSFAAPNVNAAWLAKRSR
jgi:hypothetical protein